MTPEDVAADIEMLVPFYATIRDETPRSREEMDRDLDLLLGKDGVRLVAWFWPDPTFAPSFDPLAAGLPDAEYRRVLSANLQQFMVSAASAAGVPLVDVRTHVAWSAALSPREMARLAEGHGHDLPLVVALCNSLHLDFDRQWMITDPQRLRRRIEQSLVAVEISLRLRDLTPDNLAAVRSKLPKGSREDAEGEPKTYVAPRVGSRYRPLYEALSADTRESPAYSVPELDRILKEGGEPGLPKSASRDVSWWSGTGSRAEGRPQVSAWWAAGFRIKQIIRGPGGEVLDIWFDALPGRSTWLRDPDRIGRGAYRLPGPHRMPIKLHRVGGDPATLKDQPAPTDGAPPGEAQSLSDPAVEELVELLTLEGEADRTAIAAHFEATRPSEYSVEWLTSLLTRARRQGRTVNHGTRRHPRWVTAGSRGDLMLEIAAMLNFEWRHVGRGSEIPAEFFTRVWVGTGHNPPESMTDAQIAHSTIGALGQEWHEDDHGSIAFTSETLAKLRDALRVFTQQVAEDPSTPRQQTVS